MGEKRTAKGRDASACDEGLTRSPGTKGSGGSQYSSDGPLFQVGKKTMLWTSLVVVLSGIWGAKKMAFQWGAGDGTCNSCKKCDQDTAAADAKSDVLDSMARNNGGWATDPDAASLIGSDTCDFDQVHYADISVKNFEEKYLGQKPLLISGYLDAKWDARKKGLWSRSRMAAFQGGVSTKVSSGSAIVYSGGKSARSTSLGQYLSDIKMNATHQQITVGSPPSNSKRSISGSAEAVLQGSVSEDSARDFNFDVRFFNNNPTLKKDFETPPLFTSTFMPTEATHRNQGWNMLSLGASRSGLPWHVHGETWIGLVFGIKRWAVYEPGNSPPPLAEQKAKYHPMMGSFEWFTDVLPLIEPLAAERRKAYEAAGGGRPPVVDGEGARGPGGAGSIREIGTTPLHCIQHAGDIIYLPAAFKHMTMNVGEAIGVGGQMQYETDLRMKHALDVLERSPFDFEALTNAGLTNAHKMGYVKDALREQRERDAQEAASAMDEDDSEDEGSTRRDERGAQPLPKTAEQLKWEREQEEEWHALADTSVEYFKRAVAVKPGHPEVRLLLAETMRNGGDLDSAKKVVMELVDMLVATTERVPVATTSAVLLNCARFFMGAHFYQESYDVLKVVLGLVHDYADALVDYGEVSARLKKFDEADLAFAEALSLLPPGNTECKSRQAWAHRERQLFEEGGKDGYNDDNEEDEEEGDEEEGEEEEVDEEGRMGPYAPRAAAAAAEAELGTL